MARGNGDCCLKERRKPRTVEEKPKEPTYLKRYLETCDLIAQDRLIAHENLAALRSGVG